MLQMEEQFKIVNSIIYLVRKKNHRDNQAFFFLFFFKKKGKKEREKKLQGKVKFLGVVVFELNSYDMDKGLNR